MRRSLMVAALCLCSGPAFAGWTFSDISDSEGLAYTGWVKDRNGVELEVYCDDWIPGLIDLTVHTGETLASPIEDAIAVPVKITVDAAKSLAITMFLDDLDGRLVMYTSNLDTDNFEEIMLLIAQAGASIGIASADRDYLFDAEGVFDVISNLAEICPV